MTSPIIMPSSKEMEKKVDTLTKVRVDADYYRTYYIDPITEEKWVKEHPEGEMHGGGPAQLRLIEKFPWEEDEK